MKYCSYIFLVWLAALSLSPAADLEPPTIPVGLDAYRQWERWPYQRIGARAYMRSTYDRTGGNDTVDASHFLYQESKTFNAPSMSKVRACCCSRVTTTGTAARRTTRWTARTSS